MNDDQLMKMFEYMAEMEGRLADQIANVEKKVDKTHNILDKHTDFLETDEIERLSMGKQVDRHEDWIERAAPKIGVRYSPSS